MIDDKDAKSTSGFSKIKPAPIELSSQSTQQPFTQVKNRSKKNILIWAGGGVLLMSALVVIFLLPGWVDTPTVELLPSDISSSSPNIKTGQPTSPAEMSPWERAQESELRKESQNILAEMLEAQSTLVDHGVDVWASDEFNLAKQHAESGDDLYNNRDFLQARNEYHQALTLFGDLVDKIDDVYHQFMEAGNQALIDGDPIKATEAFQLALAIDDIDRAASSGLERASLLDEVNSLIDQGDDQLKDSRFEQAKEFYQQALAIDSKSDLAKQQTQLADQKILDRNFNRNMSSGFAALQDKQFSQAQKSFNSALKIKQNSNEARNALEITKNNLTTARINSMLSTAKKLEMQEKWHEALTGYNSALSLDASLAEAQSGQKRTSVRAQIHDRLDQILNQSERLYDHVVYDEITAFHKTVSAVSNPGPVLTSQLDKLTYLLNKTIAPVPIILQSDNLTEVTFHKVGQLGYFTSKEVSVRPGNYVIVGHRDGYRDVRIELFVDPDKPSPVINIQANEKIALGK